MSSSRTNSSFTVENYRWVILLVFMFTSFMIQIVWITFAPIMNDVAPHYNVTPDAILLVTASYMIIYIPVNFPATWMIDKYGLKWGTGIGVILLGVFGFLRAFSGTNYTFVLVCEIMAGIGQPFILNSFTKVSVNWFPEEEKTLATGLGTISAFLGIMIGEILTPFLFVQYGIETVLLIYGIFSLLAMILYFAFTKNAPSAPPNKFAGQKAFNYDGMMRLFKNSNFNILLIISFVAFGAFNAISSEVDIIFQKITTPVEAHGILGGLIILGGILGAGIVSTISDMTQKRVIYIKIAIIISTILVGLLIVFTDFYIEAVVSLSFGFFLVSALPVGLIYATELTYPITEEASNGLLITLGQISSLIFIIMFEAISVTIAMALLVLFFVITAILTFFLKESSKLITNTS